MPVAEHANQIQWRCHRPGRKPQFDRAAYRWRGAINSTIGALEEARAGATRYDKLAIHYLDLEQLRTIRLLVPCLEHTLSHKA